jgi:hypothetical protein
VGVRFGHLWARVGTGTLAVVARTLFLVALGVVALALAARSLRREEPLASPYCRAGDPLAGVYHPARLRVKKRCAQASGVVTRVTFEQFDGDVHARLRTDDGDELVVEVIPQDRSVVPVPAEGQRVTVVGPLVDDTKHHWDEIHPAWWISAGRIVPASAAELARVHALLSGLYSESD